MNRMLIELIAYIGTLLVLMVIIPIAARGDSDFANNYVPGEILLKYKSGYKRLTPGKYPIYKKIKTIRSFALLESDHLKLPKALTVAQAVTLFANDPAVEFAEPNYLRYAASQKIPNDSFFTTLWGLNNTGQSIKGNDGKVDWDIDAPEAWMMSTGNRDLVIAVIDSGIDRYHPDLADNIWINPFEIADNQIDDDQNGYIDDSCGWNFFNDNNQIFDQFNHGTLVAGIIAASGDNSKGVVGVCWQASIMPLKFMDQYGVGTVADSVAAIEYACENGAQIINASYGDITSSELEYQAILAARDKGILFVTAAGNNGINNDLANHFPSGYSLDNIIAVAATSSNQQLAPFSNFGPKTVDVAAPGDEIYTTSVLYFESMDMESELNNWQLDAPWGRTDNKAYRSAFSLSDSPEGNYSDNLNISAISPAIDLSTKTNVMLIFMIRGHSQKNCDLLFLETATAFDGPWQAETVNIDTKGSFEKGISGSITGWETAMTDLSHLDGDSPVYFRFRFKTDASTTYEGWYIDQIILSASDPSGIYPENNYYQYISGTSAATPFVSGLAALIWSFQPALTYQQLKEYIMLGADDGHLAGKVVSGGQINAYKSLVLAAGRTESETSRKKNCFIGILAE